MTQVVQDPYAMQKMAGYPNATKVEQPIVPGNVQGETVDEFAQGKFNNGRPNLFAPVQKPASTEAPKKVITDSKPVPSDMETGNRVSNPIRNTDELAAAMDYTTPEQEERLRKASVANQRIMAVADALRHIGNIANTVNYAPSQQFNNPVLEEQARYEKGKAMRDKANQIYLTYQQQKAEQDRKARQWEAEQQAKRDQWNATFKYNAARDAARLAENARQFDTRQKADEVHKKFTREEMERSHKANEALRRQSNGIAAGNLSLRREEFKYKKDNGYYGRGRTTTLGTTRGQGDVFLTKNGSIELPKNLIGNGVNQESLLTAMERNGVVDHDWMVRYDRMKWDKDQQAGMLKKAVSDWLMNYDEAEDYFVKHIKKQEGENGGKSIGLGLNSGSGRRSGLYD